MMAMTWIPGMSFERYKQRTDVLFDLGEEMRLSTELCFSNATFFRDQNLGVSICCQALRMAREEFISGD